jgi:alkanesulfonate monooxygenase
MRTPHNGPTLFSTCPPSALLREAACRQELRKIARWSEDAGCEGMLVFTDNAQLDPWLVSQVVIEATDRLCPLVAVQPVYMHPYSVAKMVTTLADLYGRRVYLNMVAGGFKNDLVALNDLTPHDERYDRLLEYTTVIQSLLRTPGPVSYHGRYYTVNNLKLTPPLPQDLMPGVFVSGSSDAGMQAAGALGATAIEYPKPAAECAGATAPGVASRGIRIGIITRPESDSAWSAARKRFPEDRKGQIAHQVAMKVSDSSWHKQLSELAASPQGEQNPYWLVPFQNYKAVCPYLVGSYDEVADEVRRYVEFGYGTFILDEPASVDDLKHVGMAFERASEQRAVA